MRLVLVVTFALLVALGPAAGLGAASSRTFAFTDNTVQIGGTTYYTLEDAPHGNPIVLPPNATVTWVSATPLAAAVGFGPSDAFSPSLSLALAHGLINVKWGYVTADGTFHPLHVSPNVPVLPTSRSVAGQNVPAPGLGTPKSTVVNAGIAQTRLTGFAGTIPQGAYPALQLESNAVNALLPGPSVLGSDQASTATVPLPELPAGALVALGAAVVGAVAVVRSRKGWM